MLTKFVLALNDPCGLALEAAKPAMAEPTNSAVAADAPAVARYGRILMVLLTSQNEQITQVTTVQLAGPFGYW
jgi:hypothetical protein